MSQGCVANGNVYPSRLVIIDSTGAANKVVTATAATTQLYGVAQAGTRRVPYSGLDDAYAAIAGENVMVFTVGDRCMVEAGAAVTAGDLITSDSVGRGITASTTNYVVGEALQSASAAGELFEIRVQPGYKV